MRVLAENIPVELKRHRRWVRWMYQIKDGTEQKVPKNPRTGGNASTKIPETWGPFEEAYKSDKENKFDGVGFVFSETDEYVGIDLDDCRDPKTGKIADWAARIIKQVNSYSEISPSGKGIKILAKGDLPSGIKKQGGIAIYHGRGYFTMTGHHIDSTPAEIKKRPGELKRLYGEIMETKSLVKKEESNLPSDKEIISRAKAARDGEKFSRLWSGGTSGYHSPSEANQALCSILAYWTKGDSSAIDRLFRKSDLMRPKWDEVHNSKGETFGEMTIKKALGSFQKTSGSKEAAGIKEGLDEALESCKQDPEKAVGRILKDKALMGELAHLAVRSKSELEAFYFDLKNARVVSRDLDALKRSVNAEKKQQRHKKLPQAKDLEEDRIVKDYLPDAPIPDDFLIPHGWDVNPKGVFKMKPSGDGAEKKPISPSPILIQGRLQDRSDGSEWLRLAWPRDGRWKFRIAEREVIADTKRLVGLSKYGFPATSVSARWEVEYLSDLEAANSARLPQAIVTHKLGWQDKGGRSGFLWGRNLITTGRKILRNLRIDRMSPDEWPNDLVFFKGKDKGEEDAASGFYESGDFEKWKDVISMVKDFPIVTFAVYASLSAPLIQILRIDNFIVDLAFKTSRGKTTALKIGASCWGEPSGKKSESVVKGWGATRTWLERIPAVLNHLPFIIDETTKARDNETAKKFIYDFASGQGSGLGSIFGTRGIESWETVAITNGESRLVDLVSSGGANARVLSVWGSPFGKKSRQTASLLIRVKKTILKHFGHAGPKFVKFLIHNKAHRGTWRKRHSELTQKYQDMAGSNEVALRQAESLAVIHLTAELADEVLQLGIDYEAHIEEIARLVISATSDSDTAKRAYDLTMSWASRQQDSFWHQASQGKKAPKGGWIGARSDEGGKEFFAIYPDRLEKFLRENGFEAKATLRIWKDRGYLDTSGESKGLQKKFNIDGKRERGYVIIKKTGNKKKGRRSGRPSVRKLQ